ncbi:T9SS type A sorting domain-containing protein [Brumimicrobium glaciale]|uniref:T9SS type A sorting domain-containing protein n=1 Tax=Brumimicrobium glaciale TaxID=200475 RepID=A0A4Q4KN37_9FLAO|nr:T9SS type A sorting domain-containing protein [Brumimicrobium glaciale]RYM34197.1 T9SS type A sorting domain-containing protein [Brumimicrobium glaciale]
MKNYILLLTIICSSFFLKAQMVQFEQVGPLPPELPNITNFKGVWNGDAKAIDVDGDNDEDLLILGSIGSNTGITELYLNDGNGEYTLSTGSSFTGVYHGEAAFADIDGDNDPDLILMGGDMISQSSEIYINDGLGNFTLDGTTSFQLLFNSFLGVSDIDGDGDLDLLMSGYANFNTPVTNLYINDGSGSFALSTTNSISGFADGAVDFADIDGDNDQDLFISGRKDGSLTGLSELYINDGTGVFSLASGVLFPPTSYGTVDFGDVNGDNHQDLLITGANVIDYYSNLYINDGLGNFSLVPGNPLPETGRGDVALVDIDGDNDLDICMTGIGYLGQGFFVQYYNDGLGNYTNGLGNNVYGTTNGAIVFSDIDGDNDKDFFITGQTGEGLKTQLYTNDALGNFTHVSGTSFLNTEFAKIYFGDIDGDSDQDVLILGEPSRIYKNDGIGNYDYVTGTSISNLRFNDAVLQDMDSDNDLDLLISGWSSNVMVCEYYTNDGTGNFTLVSSSPLNQVYSSRTSFSDIDGDGDIDLLQTGIIMSGEIITETYNNDGFGNLSLSFGFPTNSGVGSSPSGPGTITFGDIDGDNDQDVLLTGRDSTLALVSQLYRNDGSGNFSLIAGTSFIGVKGCSVAFADVDGDNDQDIILSGEVSNYNYITYLYKNDGAGNYSLDPGTTFTGVEKGSIAFADVDGDADLDLIITGVDAGNSRVAELYINDGLGNFTILLGMPFTEVKMSSIAFSDIDGDNDPDLLLTGNASSGLVTRLYRNKPCYPNSGQDVQIACGSYTWIDSITYTASNNTATFSLVNSANCDSIVTLDLTINPVPTRDTTVVACQEFEWYGNFYTSSNIYTYTKVNPIGCDSIIILDLVITQPTTSNLTVVDCEQFIWFGNIYTSSNLYTHTLINNAGCDSIITLDLTINQPTTRDTIAVECEQFTWYGNTYTNSDFYTHTLLNSVGCDSVIILDLTINQPTTKDTIALACGQFTWYGNIYTSSNFYTHTLLNSVGCDSIITLDLTIGNPSVGDTIANACEQFTWYGNTYYTSNFYTHILTNMYGCDSTVYLDLTIGNSNVGDTTATACVEFTWYGNTYSSSNTYTHTLTNASGCDSLVTLDLTINEVNIGVALDVGVFTSQANGATYQWYNCEPLNEEISGETNQSYTPRENGRYSVIVTQGGCVDTSDCITLNNVGAASYAKLDYKLYPNPVVNQLTIESQGNIYEIEIYSITGQRLIAFRPQTKDIKIDFSTYGKGVYLVKMHSEGQVTTSRVIKQ